MKIPITLACGLYDRTFGLRDGTVPVEGVELMHVVVVRREIYEKNRWLMQALYKAFVQAKDLAIRRLTTYAPPHATLPWLSEQIEATRRLMGIDYWSYGLAENRHVLEAAAQHAWEQGLLARPIARIDDLFAPETHAGVLDLRP